MRSSEPAAAAERFCVTCGAREAGGRCPTCAGEPARGHTRGWPPSASTATAVAALLVAVCALALGLTARDGARDARRAAAVQRGELAALGQRLTAELDGTETAIAGLAAKFDGRQAAAPADVATIAERALPSVLTVVAGARNGSAWAVRREAGRTLLVTNFHVVSSEWLNGRHGVTLGRGDATWSGRVVDVAEDADLAVIETSASFAALPLRTEEPTVGETVVAIGSPLGLDGTATTGIVSALRDGFVQFSAAVSPGSSGGPLLDRDGRVVGVTVAKAVVAGAEGLSFAVPAARVCEEFAVCG